MVWGLIIFEMKWNYIILFVVFVFVGNSTIVYSVIKVDSIRSWVIFLLFMVKDRFVDIGYFFFFYIIK